MDIDELKKAILGLIEESDPFKYSKGFQMKYWCSSFMPLFNRRDVSEINFFIDVILDEDCWEECNTLHGIKLNRRIAAKKMLESHSCKGTVNPLDNYERYQHACWCCLKDDIDSLYQDLKKQAEVIASDINALNDIVNLISSDLKCLETDPMTEYWYHVMNENILELDLEGKHLFEYGLKISLSKMYFKRVEAVEFFWLKIKEVPENELSNQQKDDIFMNAVVQATGSPCGSQPEIFEFCFSQLDPEQYPEFLRRDYEANRYYASFIRLRNAFRFDLFQQLFNCLKPDNITKNQYHLWLKLLKIEKYPQYYERAAVELFRCMWMKEGFDAHRDLVLKEELTGLWKGKLLLPLIKKNYMNLVWAILDKASYDDFEEFKSSEAMKQIISVLRDINIQDLFKLTNYKQ